MQIITAVVPLKSFATAKSRLSGLFAPRERAALARAMAADVLAALSGCSRVTQVLVVTEDPTVAEFALGCQVQVMMEPAQRGYNAASRAAADHLAKRRATAMLLVPGDLPCITPHEIAGLIAAHGREEGVTLCPDRAGLGTNAILITPPDAMSFCFGPDSFSGHIIAARSAGIAVRTLVLSGMGFDLDVPDDIAAIDISDLGANTAAFFRERLSFLTTRAPPGHCLQNCENHPQ